MVKALLRLLGTVWAGIDTLIGITIFKIGGATLYKVEDGVRYYVAKEGGLALRWFRLTDFAATTCGMAILFRSERWANDARLIRHELTHVRQCMILGPFMMPAYGIASIVSKIVHNDWYYYNIFEVLARKSE